MSPVRDRSEIGWIPFLDFCSLNQKQFLKQLEASD